MTTFFLVLLAAVALAAGGVRDDTPEFWTRRAALRALGWRRLIWVVVQAIAGVVLVLAFTALRTSLYGALAGVAAGAAWLASLIALQRSTTPTRMELL